MSLGLNQMPQHIPCETCEITGIEGRILCVEVTVHHYHLNKSRKASKANWRSVSQCNTQHCLASLHPSPFLLCQESPNFVTVSTHLLYDSCFKPIVMAPSFAMIYLEMSMCPFVATHDIREGLLGMEKEF